MVAATIYDLRRQPGEQRLGALRAVYHVELTFSQGTDDALTQTVVVCEDDRNGESLSDPDNNGNDAERGLQIARNIWVFWFRFG